MKIRNNTSQISEIAAQQVDACQVWCDTASDLHCIYLLTVDYNYCITVFDCRFAADEI